MARPAYQLRLSDTERASFLAVLGQDETMAAFLRAAGEALAKRRRATASKGGPPK
jgi:hypothetical protein